MQTLGNSDDGSSSWVPHTHKIDLGGIPGPDFSPDPALATAYAWGATKKIGALATITP